MRMALAEEGGLLEEHLLVACEDKLQREAINKSERRSRAGSACGS